MFPDAPPAAPTLSDRFASAVPELAVEWAAAPTEQPQLLVVNTQLATDLGLDPDWLMSDAGVAFLTGAETAPGSRPVAQAYAGHQFGVFVPQLGDGRALLLGELTDSSGTVWDLHLKGSGRTPFSRGGDGQAAIGPMLREFIMSEALHALGVPTTRSLAVIATGRPVYREDAFEPLPGAMLVRVARSHLRVGSFQYARTLADETVLTRLVDFAINRHDPLCAATDGAPTECAAAKGAAAEHSGAERSAQCLLQSVIARQANLVAQWLTIGFVHGVMNTDNTTISGETIDFGPCAMLDAYDPTAVFSSIDHQGRYAYRSQPGVMSWNLTRFAETLLPLLDDDVDAAKSGAVVALQEFAPQFDRAWTSAMRSKLGLDAAHLSDDDVVRLAQGLLADLQSGAIDYTSAFRALGAAARGDEAPFRMGFMGVQEPGSWFAEWLQHRPDGAAMDLVNPVYIPRNHLVDEAVDAAMRGDLALFEQLMEAVTNPYTERAGYDRYARPAPPETQPFVSYCGT